MGSPEWRNIVLAMAFCAAAGSAAAATAVGRLAGDFDVSPTGALVYSIPIEVASGMNGLRPAIALEYNSQSPRGEAGAGWSLTGFSAIIRCPLTQALDGRVQGVRFSAEDRFCLDGQPLLLTAGSYGANGTRYRTEVHEYEVIISSGSQGQGPRSFELHRPDGLVYAYGGDAGSRLEVAPGGTVRVWALSEVRDRFGQRMSFRYTSNSSTGEYRPVEILWTIGPGESPAQARYRLAFAWEPRPAGDERNGFIWGLPWSDSQRLSGIEYAHDKGAGFTRVHHYALSYLPPATTGAMRSLLASITQCGPHDCLPPTTFHWTEEPPERVTEQTPVAVFPLDLVGDFNGDGATDFFTQTGTGRWGVRPSDPQSGGFLPAVPISNNYNATSVALVIDYDGDGLDDLMLGTTQGPNWLVYQSPAVPGGSFSVRNTGVPWSTGTVVLDIDGDGLDDLVYLRDGQAYFRRNTGGAFAAEQTAGLPAVAAPLKLLSRNATRLLSADFDGDGRGDLLLARSSRPDGSYAWEAFLSHGRGFDPTAMVRFSAAPIDGNVLVLDVNGDGLADVLRHADGGWQTFLSRGRATGGNLVLEVQGCSTPVDMPRPGLTIALDYDGDGRADILQPDKGNSWKVYLSRGNCIDMDGPVIELPIGNLGYVRAAATDFDGDGLVDVLLVGQILHPSSILRHPRTAEPGGQAGMQQPGLLREVSDGLGNRTSLSYLPLGQLPGYEVSGSSPAQTRPVRGGSLPILTRLQSNAGYELHYSYGGGRRDALGRGFLGFATVRVLDSRSGLETTSEFRQDFPFVGRIGRVTVRDQQSTVSVHESSWESAPTSVPDAAGQVHFVHLSGELRQHHEVDRDGGQHGQLVRSIQRTLDWDFTHGAIAREVEETSSPMSPGRVFRTTRNTSFDAVSAASGCLALPTRIDTSHDVSGAGTLTRSTLMSYHPGTCRLDSEIDVSSSDPTQQLRTRYLYDHLGRTSTVTRGDVAGSVPARVVRFGYPAGGSRPTSEARLIDGEADFIVGHAWNEALGLETGRSDPQGTANGWQFDDFGRLLVESRPTGASQYSYGACGSCLAATARYVIRETRSDGYWSETQHDQLGQVVGHAAVLADGTASHELFEYDALGRLLRQSVPFREGSGSIYWTSTSFDQIGRPKSITSPASESAPAGAITRYTYAGLATSETNPGGQLTTYHHDAAGRVIQVNAPLGTSASYGYDALGQLLSITDAGGHTRYSSYDQRGQLVATDDPDAGQRSLAYDVFGQVLRLADGRSPSSITTMRYDQLGRLVSRTAAEGTTTWSYRSAAGSGRGLLYKVSAPMGAGAERFEEYRLYGSNGLPLRTVTVIGSDTYQTDLAYGPEGKLVAMTYPETIGWRPRFRFEHANGYLQSISLEAGSLVPIYTLGEMDARGHDVQAIFGNGALVEHNTYDQASGRLQAIRSEADGYPISIQDYSYEWDATGNLLSRRSRLAGTSHLEEFGYDALNRLVQARRNGMQSLALSYSRDGNILSRSDVGHFSYGGGSAGPHAVTKVAGGVRGTIEYAYDGNGNMVRRGGSPLAWTSFNQPRQINEGADYVRFGYGPDHARVMQEQRAGSRTRSTHYVGPHFEVETEGSTRRYRATVFAYGRAVYSQVETTPNGLEAYYLLHDHQGSLDRLVAAAGTGDPLLLLSFDSWGKRRQPNWAADPSDLRYGDDHWVERGFTGHEHLDSVRLVHMGGRVEDPLLGRMLSPDPLIGNILNPQALNPYSYVNNNPASYFDPSGFLLSKLRKTIRRALSHVASFGRRLVSNWGRPVAAAVAAYYTAGAVSSWAYAAPATAGSAGAAAGAAGGVAATNTLVAPLIPAAVASGAAGGAVAGIIATGNLRGAVAGAITGGLMGGIGGQFGNAYSTTRVLAESAVGGIGAELQGGHFSDGFLSSGAMSSLTWASLEMRRVMVEQSYLQEGNHGGESAGFRGDGFKLGGCRAPCLSSPLGGVQNGPGKFITIDYQPGSFLDHLVETYAGPHDFLNAPIFYDAVGNNIGRPAFFEIFNATNVLLATPFAAASAVPGYAYGAVR